MIRRLTRFLHSFIASDTRNTVDEIAIKTTKSMNDKASVWNIL